MRSRLTNSPTVTPGVSVAQPRILCFVSEDPTERITLAAIAADWIYVRQYRTYPSTACAFKGVRGAVVARTFPTVALRDGFNMYGNVRCGSNLAIMRVSLSTTDRGVQHRGACK